MAQGSEKGKEGRKKAGGKGRNAKAKYRQLIFYDWCKACGICSAFCPEGVISMSPTGEPVIEHSDKCNGCRLCELRCPDFAITIMELDE